MQPGLLEREVDTVCVGRGISVHPRNDGDPGTTTGGTNHRWVRSVRLAMLNVERWTRNRDSYLTVSVLNRDPLRSFHGVLGEAQWSVIVISDPGSRHCYTGLVWIS